MTALIRFVLAILASPFKSKSGLEVENAALRQQLVVLRRKVKGRPRLTNADRWFFVQLYRWFPSILDVLAIIRPEALVRWHRAGFRRCSRSKSGRQGGRPRVQTELRALIRQVSVENPLWGAPRIHGELLKLGFEVSRSSVAKYMAKRRRPPNQGRAPFWPIMPRISPRWICSSSRPLASICSTPSSLLGWTAEILSSGSTSQDIRQRSGSRAR
jgi:ribosomal protein L34